MPCPQAVSSSWALRAAAPLPRSKSRLPTCLTTYPPTHLPTYLLTCVRVYVGTYASPSLHLSKSPLHRTYSRTHARTRVPTQAAIPRLPLNLALLNERRVLPHADTQGRSQAAASSTGLQPRAQDCSLEHRACSLAFVGCRPAVRGAAASLKASARQLAETAVLESAPAHHPGLLGLTLIHSRRCSVSSGAHGRRARVLPTGATSIRCWL